VASVVLLLLQWPKEKKDKGRNNDPQNIAWKRKYHLKQGMNSGTPDW
jgi:hypothetical protein